MSEQKWQLVPAEPTEEMLWPLDRFMRPEAARELLKEVLAAAPQPPERGGEPEVLGSFGSHIEAGIEVFNVHIGEGQSVAMVDRAHVARLQAEVERLNALLDTPHTSEWFEGVRLEAGHQIKRWGTEHDAGKTPADWFWLVGYLAGKALTAHLSGNDHKARHHTISTGAALLNWFRAITGDSTAMRPGHEEGIDAALAEGAKS